MSDWGRSQTCRECSGPLSQARAALDLTLCSGRCHRAARRHLWDAMDDGEGWRCVRCSRMTDDAALVRAGRIVTDAASSESLPNHVTVPGRTLAQDTHHHDRDTP